MRLFTDPLNYSKLKQKLSERLTEFEDTENISGYRWEQSPNDYYLGLLNGVAGIGLSEFIIKLYKCIRLSLYVPITDKSI